MVRSSSSTSDRASTTPVTELAAPDLASRSPSRLTRWLPRLITGLGIVHFVYAAVESHEVIGDMVGDGVVGAADAYRRNYVVWFLVGGMTLLTLGAVTAWAVRTIGRIPAFIGWWMVCIGVFDSVLEPDGGGWLVLLLGALVVYDARRSLAQAP